jgi:hypothetical protein
MQFSNFTVTPSAITPCGEDKVKINFTIVGMHNMKTMFDIPVSGKQVLFFPFICSKLYSPTLLSFSKVNFGGVVILSFPKFKKGDTKSLKIAEAVFSWDVFG